MRRILYYLIFFTTIHSFPLQAQQLNSFLQFLTKVSADQETPVVLTEKKNVGSFTLDEHKFNPAGSMVQDLPFDPGFTDDVILSAILSGQDAVPEVATDAVGLATMFFDSEKHTAKVNITATGLSGPITGVDIYEGDIGSTGSILFPLDNVGNRVQMEIQNITDLELISLINAGTYVNILTAAHPTGEIRGQLLLEQDVTFLAAMSGEEEVPEVVTDGLGLAAIYYTQGQLSINLNAQLTGLSSAIEAVHLHEGLPGENGPVIVDLSGLIEGNTLSGRLDISIENLISLFVGNVYINVHTADHSDGEIRGQLTFLPGITFDGWMSGMQEVPVSSSPGTGLVVATLFPGISDIALWMLVDGISGPIDAAHLHEASLQENGGVVLNLSGDIVGNSILHLGVIEDGTLSSLLEGKIYINAHTAAFPDGEIRGQLFRRARDGYGLDLCAEQEVGVVMAPGSSGSALVSFDRDHTNTNLYVVTDGLTGPISASHIHEAPIGMNGGVIADLTAFYANGSMAIFGAETDTSIINAVRSGNTYINVHTAMHSAGEIRGQIVKEFLCSLETGVDPLEGKVSDVRLSPVPVTDYLNVLMEVQSASKFNFSLTDITGKMLSNHVYDLFLGENLVTLDTWSLLPGFYTLRISDGKAAQAFKFVK